MAMRIDIDVIGEDTVSLELLRFGERLRDPEPALREIADLFRSQIEDRFDAEGPGWEPLKPSTLAAKSRQGLADKILQATGAGKASLTEADGDNVEHISGDTLIFASSVRYMSYHQSGTSRMAQRKVIDFSSAERSAHAKIIQRYAVEGRADAGYRIAVGI